MSDQTPDRSEPPYPGWSVEQPPDHRSGDAGPATGQGRPVPGWGAPGGSDAPATPPHSGQQSWSAPSGSGGQAPGWSSAPQWGWQRTQVKPGVIPLRPLGVGEILDGAVTTIRRNLGAMLGLSVVVAAFIQLAGLYFNWAIYDRFNELSSLPTTAPADAVLGLTGDLLLAVLAYAGLDWLGRTVLTGILTVVVSRAVLGEHMTAGEAWRRARPRLLRLLGLTIVYSLIAAGPALVALLVTFALAIAVGPGAVALGFLLIPAGVFMSIWLAIRYVLSTPIIMIETVQPPNGAPVPIGIIGSLRRSADVVRGSWWRCFGIYLLIMIIVIVVIQALSVVSLVAGAFSDPFEGVGFGTLLLGAFSGVLATAVTAPFLAGAVALLYIDRRIRAEGLDIDLARAAGVTIPGRTDVPPGGSPQGS